MRHVFLTGDHKHNFLSLKCLVCQAIHAHVQYMMIACEHDTPTTHEKNMWHAEPDSLTTSGNAWSMYLYG